MSLVGPVLLSRDGEGRLTARVDGVSYVLIARSSAQAKRMTADDPKQCPPEAQVTTEECAELLKQGAELQDKLRPRIDEMQRPAPPAPGGMLDRVGKPGRLIASYPVEPRTTQAMTDERRELARRVIESQKAREGEDVDAWAERLAADSVAAGEAEYGPGYGQRTTKAAPASDLLASVKHVLRKYEVSNVNHYDPLLTDALEALRAVVVRGAGTDYPRIEVKEVATKTAHLFVNGHQLLFFADRQHTQKLAANLRKALGLDPCPETARRDEDGG